MTHNLYPGIIPIQQARASAILPAAGAWAAAPLELDIRGADELSILFSYTRGGAAGAFDLVIVASPWLRNADAPAGSAVWYQSMIYAAGAVVAGADTQSRIQNEYLTYQAVAAGLVSGFYGVFRLAENAARIRILARESGALLTPGTLQLSIIIR